MNENLREKIGNQIRRRREELGITQVQLSDLSGIDRANISKIERGTYNISIDILSRISEALNLDVELRPKT